MTGLKNVKEIEEVLNYFYGRNVCYTFGLGKRFAFYRFYESKEPNIELAQSYLKSLAKTPIKE